MEIAMRVESHQINKNHELFNFCDRKCYESKKLYNKINYRLRQRFTESKGYKKENFNISAFSIAKESRRIDEEFISMGSNFADGTVAMLSQDWKSFFASIKDYSKNPSKYKGRPGLPMYAPSGEIGRKVAIDRKIKVYDKGKHEGKFKFSCEKVYFEPNIKENIKQVRIVPSHPRIDRITHFTLEIVYEIEIPEIIEKINRIAGIDLGIDNLATVVNNIDIKPFVINGKPLKSMNRYYNKKKAKYMSYIGGKGTSKRLRKLDMKRNNKVKHYMHNASRKIVDWCNENNIDTVIIGNNKDWKRNINIGKVNNQKFVSIPFRMLIEQIKYKCEEYGIKVEVTEESCTSKANFLNADPLPDYKTYCKDKKKYLKQFTGKRTHRGLYKTNEGIKINADVNGAYNIIRKVYSDKINTNIKDENLLHPTILNVG